MDIEDLRSGPFNTALFEQIESSSDVVVVLTPNSLDRCVNNGDWVRLELAHAIKCKKNVIPVMARGFSFPEFPLPEDIADLPNYHGVEASHVYFEASMDKLALLLVGNHRRRFFRKTAIVAGITLIACTLFFSFWQKNKQSHISYISEKTASDPSEELNKDLTGTLSHATLDAGSLRKAEGDLNALRESSINKTQLAAVEALFTERTLACVSNELQTARELISNWNTLPEYAEWNRKLSSAESERAVYWWAAWNNCRSVITSAQSVLADKVSEAQAVAAAQVAGSSATDALNWSPDSWYNAIECYNRGVRAQKANHWREAWTNFEAFKVVSHRAFTETGEFRGQYVAAKGNYQRTSLYLAKQGIRTLLTEHAGKDLSAFENSGALAELQINPEGTANYINAVALWPKIVDKAITDLLASVSNALAEKQYERGLQAVTNVMILANGAGIDSSISSKWVSQAFDLKNKLLALIPRMPAVEDMSKKMDTLLPPLPTRAYLDAKSKDPGRFPGVFKVLEDRFESAGKDHVYDRLLKKTWILIPNLLTWEDADDKADRMDSRLPSIAELKTLITQEPEGRDKIFINTGYFMQSFRIPRCWTSKGGIIGLSQKYYVDFEKQTWETTSKSEMSHVFLIQDK
jgi:hypothetical protein